ncbi:hypothetical protein BDF20DRAFT_504141 [Mycotypha africana]|uniref:uncharacterized protein n=1 Tax=Mycotypha africana TaxID=64632 RepID=UPI0023019742|nr:uncharacterized protein BDF20DRAFT_504141 [Mycotypha africana]KAI8979423.1 hypothetical protein BDF20DRAFT_504141 [Mycotypha africana]
MVVEGKRCRDNVVVVVEEVADKESNHHHKQEVLQEAVRVCPNALFWYYDPHSIFNKNKISIILDQAFMDLTTDFHLRSTFRRVFFFPSFKIYCEESHVNSNDLSLDNCCNSAYLVVTVLLSLLLIQRLKQKLNGSERKTKDLLKKGQSKILAFFF